jgi:hypothetical protein
VQEKWLKALKKVIVQISAFEICSKFIKIKLEGVKSKIEGVRITSPGSKPGPTRHSTKKDTSNKNNSSVALYQAERNANGLDLLTEQ